MTGLPLNYLVSKAMIFARDRNWIAFNALMEAMIYGLVLFLVFEKLVHVSALYVFMNSNPIPTLLADTYYNIHSRHEKKGEVICYAIVFYKWLMSHMPSKGPFIQNAELSWWSQCIMGLTSYDITWRSVLGVKEIIVGCGEFPNVPLMGTRGCINYNTILARR